MEQRAILAVVLSILFFIGWNYLVLKKIDKKPIESVVRVEKRSDRHNMKPEIVKRQAKETKKIDLSEKGKQYPSVTVRQDLKDIKEINVKTNLYEIVFTNKGGLIKSINLKKHLNKDSQPLNIVFSDNSDILPLYIEFENSDISYFVNNLIFKVSSENLYVTESDPEVALSFNYKDRYGFKITKVITFYDNQYKIDVETKIKGADFLADSSYYSVLWGTGINSGSTEKGRYAFEGATTFIDGDTVNNSNDDVKDNVIHKGPLQWTALQNKFFAAALVPVGNSSVKAVITKEESGKLSVGLQYSFSGNEIENEVILFAGPKEFDRLKLYGINLERLIDYGVFQFLAKPLLVGLKLFYRFFNNYGVAIIILTVLIKVLFLPLSQKSYTAMEKMKKFQPQIKILQERYKDDKQKLNEETMRFYKEKKLNPFGGCLPMVIQIPVFFALYNVLLNSVELRHSPFIFWIHDLSVKDPYYITPILMGITMVIQQRMTPTTGDPTQAKLMMFMPIIFTFMFLNFPVGLVIYWLINNLMTIGQQYLISKKQAV